MPQSARIPADVERADPIMFGLTWRQLVILTLTLAIAGGLAWATVRLTPLPLAVGVGVMVPVLAVGVGLALGQRDGLSLDRWAWAALRQTRAPRQLVAAPEGILKPPDWLTGAAITGEPTPSRPAPLRLPATDLDASGVVDLGREGAALVCRATPVNLGLRTPEEQTALVGAFARFLHQLTGPTQVLVRAHPVDLAPAADRLIGEAGGLPHPALETAATQHAAFLTELAGRRDVLRRELLIVFRDPTPNAVASGQAAGLRRRAEESASLLAVAGVTVTALDQTEAAAALAPPPAPASSSSGGAG